VRDDVARFLPELLVVDLLRVDERAAAASANTIYVRVELRGMAATGSFQTTSWNGAASLSIGANPGAANHIWEGYFDNVTVDML
jgi:hypothetical protein